MWVWRRCRRENRRCPPPSCMGFQPAPGDAGAGFAVKALDQLATVPCRLDEPSDLFRGQSSAFLASPPHSLTDVTATQHPTKDLIQTVRPGTSMSGPPPCSCGPSVCDGRCFPSPGRAGSHASAGDNPGRYDRYNREQHESHATLYEQCIESAFRQHSGSGTLTFERQHL